MLEKELRYPRIASHSILEPKHVVPFVLEDKIVDLDTPFAKVGGNLSGFRLRDPGVILSLDDHQWSCKIR